MPILVEHALRDDILVLAPKGRIDTNTAKSFEEQSAPLIDKAPGKIVIDFSGINYISSAGLRALLSIGQRVKSAGGKLTLCAAQGPVGTIFQVCGFDSVFGLHATFAEAKAALGA